MSGLVAVMVRWSSGRVTGLPGWERVDEDAAAVLLRLLLEADDLLVSVPPPLDVHAVVCPVRHVLNLELVAEVFLLPAGRSDVVPPGS